MRKATLLALFGLLCLAAFPVFAQDKTPTPNPPSAESTAESTMQANTAETGAMNPLNLIGSDNVTFVRFVNTADDVPSVDLYVEELGDKGVVKDLAFGKVSELTVLPAGKYNVVARAAGSSPSDTAITTMSWDFQPDTSWLVALVGLTSKASLQLEPISLVQTDIASDMSRVRVVNLVADAPALTVSGSTGEDFGKGLAWSDVFDADMKAGSYKLSVASDAGDSLLKDSAVELKNGGLSTVVLAGSVKGTQPLQLITFNSAENVSRVQFINNSNAAIQIFARPGDVELVQSLAAGATSDWVSVPSGSVTFVAYAPGTGPSGQELGSWIGEVHPLRDVTVTFTGDKTATASDPVFSSTVNDIRAAG